MDEKQMKKEIRVFSNWSSIPALTVMGATLFGVILTQILDAVLSRAGASSVSFAEVFGYLASVPGLILAAVLFYPIFGRRSGLTLRSTLCKPQKSAGWIVKWGVIACGLSLLVMELLTLFVSFFGKEAVTTNTSASTPLWSQLLIVSFLGPVMEEVTLRGMTCRCAQVLGERFAMIFSALLFGLMHGNPIQATYAFVAGLCMAYIFTKTRSLIPCLIIHMLFNLMGSLEEIFGLEESVVLSIGSSIRPAQLAVMLIHSGLMLAAVILLVTELIKGKKREKLQAYSYPMPKGKAIGAYLGAPVTVIALVSTAGLTAYALVQQYLL